jgi:hypothetical protein
MTIAEQVTAELHAKAKFADAVLELVKAHGYMPKRQRAVVKVKEVVKYKTRAPRRTKAQMAAEAEQPAVAA